jgi:hypothetical protein
MRVNMPAIIDQAGRPFNVDEADGISRRHSRGEREVPALDPLDVRPELLLETAPDTVRFHHERHFGRVPPLLTHEPPVAARLLSRDLVPLHQHHADAAPGELVGDRAPDDLAPDHDDVRPALHPKPPSALSAVLAAPVEDPADGPTGPAHPFAALLGRVVIDGRPVRRQDDAVLGAGGLD